MQRRFAPVTRLRFGGIADRIRSIDLADGGPPRVGVALRCSSPARTFGRRRDRSGTAVAASFGSCRRWSRRRPAFAPRAVRDIAPRVSAGCARATHWRRLCRAVRRRARRRPTEDHVRVDLVGVQGLVEERRIRSARRSTTRDLYRRRYREPVLIGVVGHCASAGVGRATAPELPVSSSFPIRTLPAARGCTGQATRAPPRRRHSRAPRSRRSSDQAARHSIGLASRNRVAQHPDAENAVVNCDDDAGDRRLLVISSPAATRRPRHTPAIEGGFAGTQ